MDVVARRVNVLNNHLGTRFPESVPTSSLEKYRAKGQKINQLLLRQVFMGEFNPRMESMRSFIEKSPLFDHYSIMLLTQQEKYAKVLELIVESMKHEYSTYQKDLKDPAYKMTISENLTEFDISLGTRSGVHLGLYTDTIQNLGTKKHEDFINRAYSIKDFGSFALTEMGHGSNVAGIETTAVYDHTTREFIINTPTKTAAKWWIGAVGKTANMSIVWAQMYVAGENKGVHAFVVEIRDYNTHEVKQGVIAGECGQKIELEGVDNGFLIFKNYRVPYDSLLDHFSQINSEGKFKTTIKNKEKRLGIMLGGLIRGRIVVVLSSEIALRNAVTIALRFAAVRTQFAYGDSAENSILDYPLHRHRLIPILAKVFAIRAGLMHLYKMFRVIYPTVRENPESAELNELHSILSAYKCIATSYSFTGIQECRESCGGMGFSAYAGLGRLRNTVDVLLTWEGDNNVLLQQTGKTILKLIQKSFKGIQIESPTLKFLTINLENIKWPLKTSELFTYDNICKVFEDRICFLAKKAIEKLQKNTEKYNSPIEIWNNSLVNYVNTLSYAYGEYILYREFNLIFENLKKSCSATAEIIGKLHLLYALDCFERSQRIYIEFGCTYKETIIVKDLHTQLCNELGDYSINIVDSIASLDKCLGSVLGCKDGNIYERLVNAVESEKDVYTKTSWLELIKTSRTLIELPSKSS
ncbi:hypothetical protein SteCoe_33875 [Stentor coeruleus]|uniref:Acyl-coenzyme A oxidase n=1 Tax=Stentor coeruleus TaxID=5963 RepID=A0A1R2AVQ8_9CILI|nr:hypothetical protein SteCoe_33875 [Stentor coeruleus]